MVPRARIGYYRARPAKDIPVDAFLNSLNHPLYIGSRQSTLKENVKEIRRSDSVANESAVLVGVLLNGNHADPNPLEELEGLAEAAGTKVVGRMTQRRDAPDAATYLGSGKVEELKMIADSEEADLVIFDNDLSPGQTRHLEMEIGLKVIDRTELILDIFASRAKTHEARLAVELAQLEYAMPRLKRMWTHLSRQAQGGVGLRGPGEKQLEVDRRLAEKRVSDLKRELKVIESRRHREVAARQSQMTVSLVGYTNAGKSTLLNRMTGADVFTKNLLFATLDTRTRRWQLPGWGPVLLSDTVGFIRDLPHGLVASFRATLEEARQAHLLLHVADASNPAVHEQIAAAYKVLAELGIEQKDTLLVLNKADALPDRLSLDGLLNRYPNAVPISARTGQGLDRLAAAVSAALSRNFLDLELEFGVENGKLLAYLAAHGEVLSQTFSDSRVVVHCRIAEQFVSRMDHEGVVVRDYEHHNGQPLKAP